MGRQIIFAETDRFLDELRLIWRKREVWLAGGNELAGRVAAAAKARKVRLHDGLPAGDALGANPLIVVTETDGAALQTLLLSCLDLPAATIMAPVTDRHFSKHPLFLISIPKAGTHLVYELARALGYGAGIEPPEFPLAQHWYCLEYSNSHTVAADFFVESVRRAPFGNRHHAFMKSPALFIYRHPLDILVSEAHYYHLDGKSPFAGWFDGLDFGGRADRLLDDNFLLGSLRERVGGFLPWLEFPNVISLSFEELVGAAGGGREDVQRDLIWSILLKLQAPGDPDVIAATLFNRESATFRDGRIGAFARELPADAVAKFGDANADILAAFGYSAARPAALPAWHERRLRRPVTYSAADFDAMPITIEPNYLGCNLVRYAGLIYAVPLTAGSVDLTKLPAARLAALPAAPDIASLRALLLAGGEEWTRRQDALRRLGTDIAHDAPAGCYSYWTDGDTPTVIESYAGFNVVFYSQRFYGLRQSLGPVPLDGDMAAMLAAHSLGDVVVASTAALLRDEILGLSTAQRLRGHVEALQTAVTAQCRKIAAEVSGLQNGLAEAGREMAARLGQQADQLAALTQAGRDGAATAAQIQDQFVTLEGEIGALRSALERRAALAEAAARTQADRLGAQIAALQAAMQVQQEAAGLADAAARKQADRLGAQIAELQVAMRAQADGLGQQIAELQAASDRDRAVALAAAAAHDAAQQAALAGLREELTARDLAANALTHSRIDLLLEELISQRGALGALQKAVAPPLRWWKR
jgi:hypothetical protein